MEYFTTYEIAPKVRRHTLMHPYGAHFTLNHLQQTLDWLNVWESNHRVVVTTSRRSDAFSLGGDLGMFSEQNLDQLECYADLCIEIIAALHLETTGPLMSIAAVNGKAFGGGFELALAHDFIISHPEAEFCLPETNYGLFPGMGATSFLGRRLSKADALRAILDGVTFTGAELYELGVVDRISEKPEALACAMGVAHSDEVHYRKFRAIKNALRRANPVTMQELVDTVVDWGQLVHQLPPRNVARMKAGARIQRSIAK